jgi:TetR/AcrR family transcriptional regulator, mexJK operon transcriptional repressor
LDDLTTREPRSAKPKAKRKTALRPTRAVSEPAPVMSRLGDNLRPGSLKKYRAILEAASRIFIAQGYGPASMDMIADEANVSKRTVYGHFEHKYALFAAVVQTLCANALSPALHDLAFEDARPEDVLEEFGVEFLRAIYTPEQIELYRTVTSDARMFAEIGAAMFDGPIMRSERTLAGYLEHQVRTKRMHFAFPDMAAAQFIGMLKTNLHMRLIFKPGSIVGAAQVSEAARAAVDLFLNGARPAD